MCAVQALPAAPTGVAGAPQLDRFRRSRALAAAYLTAGEARLTEVLTDAGFTRIRRAAATPSTSWWRRDA